MDQSLSPEKEKGCVAQSKVTISFSAKNATQTEISVALKTQRKLSKTIPRLCHLPP